jgi:hypothetical protein
MIVAYKTHHNTQYRAQLKQTMAIIIHQLNFLLCVLKYVQSNGRKRNKREIVQKSTPPTKSTEHNQKRETYVQKSNKLKMNKNEWQTNTACVQ